MQRTADDATGVDSINFTDGNGTNLPSGTVINIRATKPEETIPAQQGLVISLIDAAYTLNDNDLGTSITVDSTSAAFTVTLDSPSRSGYVEFIKENSGANNVTLAGGTATLRTKSSNVLMSAQLDRVLCRYDQPNDEWICYGDLS